MDAESLSWAEAVGRMSVAGYRTATGRIHYQVPQGARIERGTTRFWHVAPDRWRVEDERGVVHLQDGDQALIRDKDGRMQSVPAASVMWSFSGGHPWVLLGSPEERASRFTRAGDFSVPLEPGEPVTVAGRRAWVFTLGPTERKPNPLRIAVDDATGAVLSMAAPESGTVIEMTEFVPDAEIPEHTFGWDGPVATDWQDQRRRDADSRRWLAEQRLPVPRWWPAGLGYAPLEGEPETGTFSVTLEVRGFPELARWPKGGAPPRQWADRTADRHVHRWSDARWEWALAVSEPCTDDDLAKIIASMPEP